MGFFDYVADVYSSISIKQVEAEEPDYQGQADKSGEQSSSKDARSGGVGSAQHDRGATTRGGVSTSSPASGTNEESDSEKEANAEDADKAKSRSSDEDGDASSGKGAVPDTDGDGEDEGEEAEEEEEDEDDDEPKDPKPRLEEECMKTSQCYPLKHHYEECAERVQQQIDEHGKPEEDCVEEYFHLMHCASQCASAKLFRALR